MSPSLGTGRSLGRRLAGVWARLLLVSLALGLLCLAGLLELGPGPGRLLVAVGGVAALAMALVELKLLQRALRPMAAYLDHRSGEGPSAEQRRQAFAAVLDLPRRAALLGAGGWLLPLAVLLPVMALRFPGQWGLFESGALVLAGAAAAFVNGSCLLFRVKCLMRPLRAALTNELPEPSERRTLVRPLGLRTKLLVCVSGVALVPVLFAVLHAGASGQRSLEAFALGWQQRALEDLVLRLPAEDDPAAAPLSVLARGPGLAPLQVQVLEVSQVGQVLGLGPGEENLLLGQLRRGQSRGDSSALPSEQLFSWLRLKDGRLLVASTPRSELRAGGWGSGPVAAGLLLATLAAALGLAWLLAGDVCAAAHAARAEVERMASGDLTRGRSCESEDELGELARAVEALGGWLRTTIAGVVRASERVEGTAGEVASVAEDVAAVTAEQVGGIQQAATSMEALNLQVRGIADSSQALNASVEESSSSILEMGAAGEELRQTATVLSKRVEEVSVSLEQMVRSVQQVSENTEGLSDASVETSASMEEMAVSMREVEQAAEETARLSREVVESAEGGQLKVRQTIEGMDAIRDATETAEQVIRNLGGRATEIGAIVDVIDDVADETNLLALNAAIIAAQAGEHGRAFSVVADEIKDLADRVLASTKEIGNLIRGVQEETTNAIGAIEFGTASVASGVDLSAEAGVALEDITRASRDSGTRISAIVTAVREQVKAASHVVNLMERVRGGIDEIRAAATEQHRGNSAVHQSSLAMREVTQQVRGTTEEQARGSGRLRDSIEEVRDAVGRINDSLQEQSVACRSAVEFLEAVYHRTRSNEESASRLDHATRSLLSQAEMLRQAMQHFRI